MSDIGDANQLVTKDTVRVVAVVDGWRIEGNLYVLKGSRLTDSINQRTKDFLAVTEAQIFDAKTGALLFQTPYLALNREAISMIFLAS